MSTIRNALIAVAASLGLATAGMAQEPAHAGMDGMMSPAMQHEMQGMMQEMEGMMQQMMGIHAYAPAVLLEQSTDLSLTADQVRKLKGLAEEISIAKSHAKSEHDLQHAKVIEQFSRANPDPARVKTAGQEAMRDMAAAHGIELSAIARAKGLLTDAQRASVDAKVAEHAHMMMKHEGAPKDGGHEGHH